MHELLSNNSLFVGQLCEDKSLVLCTRHLIFFTTDPQSSELLYNNSLLELIYFLDNVTVLNARAKSGLADVNSYCTWCNVVFMLERRYKYM